MGHLLTKIARWAGHLTFFFKCTGFAGRGGGGGGSACSWNDSHINYQGWYPARDHESRWCFIIVNLAFFSFSDVVYLILYTSYLCNIL